MNHRQILAVVEGHGEVIAVPNLINRLAADLGLPLRLSPNPIRMNVRRPRDAERVGELTRTRPRIDGVLVLRDDDDGCPAADGPEMARWFKALSLPFPTTCCLFHREYETLFLAALPELAGQPLRGPGGEREGLPPGAALERDPVAVRDAKGVISGLLPAGRVYKPTTDQLALTRLIRFEPLRNLRIPCFETLDRALGFLARAATPGTVFPLDRS